MPISHVEVDHIDNKTMPQTIEQIAQCSADDQRIGDVIEFCVARERYIITNNATQIAMAIPAKNQRCQPPLSARKLKAAP